MRFINDLKKYKRYLTYAARAQLKSEVSNSYLDWVWWILEPFFHMLIYTVIFGYVFNAAEKNFPVFIFIGVSIWGFFSKTVNQSVKLIKNHKSIVTKVYVPKQILLLCTMCVNGFKMFVSLLVVVAMMVIFKIKVDWHLIYIVPGLLLLVILTYGICCFLLHYGVYVEDLQYIVEILLKMFMYFTGIFYSVPNRIPAPYGDILNSVNPIAYIISTLRNGMLYQSGASLTVMGVWYVAAAILVFRGTRVIYQCENSYVKLI